MNIQGHIYTGNPKALWAQALAITGAQIDAVGTDQEILARKQPKTDVIDLRGQTVIPGISDSHAHMWMGALELHGFNLSAPEPASRRTIQMSSSKKSKPSPRANLTTSC